MRQYYGLDYIDHGTVNCTVHNAHGTAQSAHRPQHCTWAHPDFHMATHQPIHNHIPCIRTHHCIFYFIFSCTLLFYQLLEVITPVNN